MQRLNRNTSSSPGPSTPPAGSKRAAPEAGGASVSEPPAKRPRTDTAPGGASSSALTPSRLNADAPTVAGPVAPEPGQPGFKQPRFLRDLRRAQGVENWRIPNVPGQSGGNRIDLNPYPRRKANDLIEANKPLPNPDGTGPQTNADLRRAGANNLFTNEKGILQNKDWPKQMIGSVEGQGNVLEAQAAYINGNPRIHNPDNLPLTHHNTSGTQEDKAKLRDFMTDGNLNGSGRSITQQEFGLLAGVNYRSVGRWARPDMDILPPPQAMDYVGYVRQNPVTANHTPPPIAAGTPPDMSPSQPGYPPTPKGYIHDPYPVPPLNARPTREEVVAGPGAGSLPHSLPPLSAHPGNSPATDFDLYGATPLGHPSRPAAPSPGGPATPSPAGSGAGYSPLWDDQSRFDRDQMRIGAFNTPVASPRAQTPQPDLAGAGSPGGPSQPPPTPSLPVLRPGEYVGEGHSLLAQYAPRPQGEDQ